jgi:ribosomal protein S18 acetylase RimI-like enzyme
MYATRPITEKDFASVCGFFAAERELHYAFPGVTYPLTGSVLKTFVESRSDPTLLLADRAIAGFADLFNILPNVECFIGNVIVNKDFRRRGAGMFLIKEMTDIAVSRHGVSRLIIPCWCENTGALLLYSKMGFKPYDILIKNHADSESVPVLLLEKNLDADLPEPSPVGTV